MKANAQIKCARQRAWFGGSGGKKRRGGGGLIGWKPDRDGRPASACLGNAVAAGFVLSRSPTELNPAALETWARMPVAAIPSFCMQTGHLRKARAIIRDAGSGPGI